MEPRVFVVDDDESVRTSLTNLLSTEDYSVEVFASAAQYLACIPHPGPACLVLDVRLPGLDGLALQRRLKEEGRMEQIVFITGHGGRERLSRARAQPCGAPGRARCVAARDERPGSAGMAARGLAQHEGDGYDR
jgi:DNA-binding NtrC family response regulator